MRARVREALALAAVLAVSARASAHELRCEKEVNGASVATIDTYPANVTWEITVRNVNADDPSTATGLEDALLEDLGFSFDPAAPVTIGVEDSVSYSFNMVVASYADCVALAGEDESASQVDVDNEATVSWDVGSAMCSARLICIAPERPQPAGATRTMGFWKTHEDALQTCLDQGSIDLGFITISTLEDALGLLWGSPSRFGDKTRRSDLDMARFLLARQTLAGICNERVFGTTPTPADLLEQAVAALAGTSCTTMLDLESQVDAYNSSGDAVAFPDGFDAGPATPKDAQDKAVDPTSPSGGTCQ